MKKLLLFVGLALASVAHGQGLQSSINWLTSASPPATPSGTKGATLYVDSGKRPSWLFQSGFSASWDGSGLTVTRIITLPNAAGTLLLNTNPINTTVTNLDTITATASTDLTLNAGSGGNNAINLYLPGTGPVRVGASAGTYAAAAALAIASSTSATKGISFGTDAALYRSATSTVNLDSLGAQAVGLSLVRSTATSGANFGLAALDFYNGATQASEIIALSNSATDSGYLVFKTKATGASLTTALTISVTPVITMSFAATKAQFAEFSGDACLHLLPTATTATSSNFVLTQDSGNTYLNTVGASGSVFIQSGNSTKLTVATSGNITAVGTMTVIGGATFLTTSTALTDGAAASVGTLTNAPAAGNPTKWIAINDNGTSRKVPAW